MNSSRVQVQLPLCVQIRDDASFGNFYVATNQELVDSLQRSCLGKTSDGAIYFSGPASAGKTHLLHAVCHAAQEHDISSVYLPLAELHQESPELLEGLEQLQLICVDDLQAIAANAKWEEGLFHLFNRVFDSGAQIIFSADKAINNLGIELPDLTSRLAWGFVYRLHPLDDNDKLCALQERAKHRGFELPVNVGQYLLRRYPRDMQALYDLLQELDMASLAAQRNKLSIPFVKQWLEGGDASQSSLF